MINTKTGEILLGDWPSVSSKTVLNDLTQLKDFKMDLTVENGIYKRFFIGQVQIAKTDFFASLAFESDRLKSISLSLAAEHASSWGDWSHEKEKKTKVLHNKFLQEQFNSVPPYKLAWGSVESCLDVKTGDARIIVTYV